MGRQAKGEQLAHVASEVDDAVGDRRRGEHEAGDIRGPQRLAATDAIDEQVTGVAVDVDEAIGDRRGGQARPTAAATAVRSRNRRRGEVCRRAGPAAAGATHRVAVDPAAAHVEVDDAVGDRGRGIEGAGRSDPERGADHGIAAATGHAGGVERIHLAVLGACVDHAAGNRRPTMVDGTAEGGGPERIAGPAAGVATHGVGKQPVLYVADVYDAVGHRRRGSDPGHVVGI